jgi:Ca2+-binding RTX toxin-like protein
VELTVGGTSLGGLAPTGLPVPPFNPDHRYERVFAATPFINGVLGTRLASFSSPGTTTIKVELFGERVSSCNGLTATIEAVAPGIPRFGTPGDDVIVGTEGDDLLFGLRGIDVICGLGGNDLILGNEDSDRLFGGPGNDTLTGGDDDARDFLFGEGDQDTLRGGKGNDVLDGGPDNDRMIGGPGNDRLFVNGEGFSIGPIIMLGGEEDVLNGGPGDDLADYSQLPGPVRVDLEKVSQRGGETLTGIQNIRGTPRDDRLTGDSVGNILIGGGGNDRLNAGIARDPDFDSPDDLRGGADFDTCIFELRRRNDRVKGCEIVRGDVE